MPRERRIGRRGVQPATFFARGFEARGFAARADRRSFMAVYSPGKPPAGPIYGPLQPGTTDYSGFHHQVDKYLGPVTG